jgi:hypothetical protein
VEELTGLYAKWLFGSVKDTEIELAKNEEELMEKEADFHECTDRIKKLVYKLQVLEVGIGK